QQIGEPLLAPHAPPLGAIAFPLPGLGDEPLGVRAVAPPAEVPPVERGGDGAGGRGQAVVQPEGEVAHGARRTAGVSAARRGGARPTAANASQPRNRTRSGMPSSAARARSAPS